MKKFSAILSTIMILVLISALLIGCSSEPERKLVSRPVQAKNLDSGSSHASASSSASQRNDDSASASSSEIEEPDVTPVEEPVVNDRPSTSGSAQCEQLSLSDLTNTFGGTWSKTSDCPQRPAMPSGVSVCQCSYQGPKTQYVNVEVQKYDSSSEAMRVYNMYCSSESETAGVGSNSCILERTSSMSPNFVFFNKGNYFVKVSCLGGTCPFSGISSAATTINSQI